MKTYFEKNPESIPYLDRLVDEWYQHGKVIIACDYDDTISPWKMKHENHSDFTRVIELLKAAKHTGAFVTIWSACDKGRFDEIRSYCKSKGLDIDSINENPIDLPYGNNGKIYANIYLDDRSGLNESLNILEFAMYKVRGMRNSDTNLSDVG